MSESAADRAWKVAVERGLNISREDVAALLEAALLHELVEQVAEAEPAGRHVRRDPAPEDEEPLPMSTLHDPADRYYSPECG